MTPREQLAENAMTELVWRATRRGEATREHVGMLMHAAMGLARKVALDPEQQPRVLVCGSRSYPNLDDVDTVMDRVIPDGALVIAGGAHGVDTRAAVVAMRRNLETRVMPADWKTHGKRAGYLRNVAMLDERPNVVLAFPDGEAKGTNMTITEARKRSIFTLVYPSTDHVLG